ncbi:MAG: acyltransferase domain-containing protein [Actinopolymorphaceae bacterium]
MDLDISEVARRLALSSDTVAWLSRIDPPASAPGPVLPDHAEAERLLVRLDVDEADRVETLSARPDPGDHPELWWVLNRAYHEMLATMGACVSIDGWSGYPGLPAETGPVGMHLPVWTYLALLPATRRYHAERGIPDDLSWYTLADPLGKAMRAHRSVTGTGGLALFGFGWSLTLRFRGVDYELGRLGFNRGAMSLGNGSCGYALSTHIPGGRPLDAAECDASFVRAREFFPRHFPEEPVAFFGCESWLMDPQLAEYLPENSRLVQFQRRFQLLPLTPEEESQTRTDGTMAEYVFGRHHDNLDDYPQDTTLRRAYVTHLRSGRHWHSRAGWFPF